VLFHQKIENRSHRCTLGFLISWNGFAETVTKEMLRESREEALVVPIAGEEIRGAVRSKDFTTTLLSCWDRDDAESALSISAYRPPAHSPAIT